MSGLLERFLGKTPTAPEKRSWDNYVATMRAGGVALGTGDIVSQDAALSIAAVYACIRVLAESIAALPLAVYKKDANGGRHRLDKHPVTRLLRIQPNPLMTAYEWRELMVNHVNLRGNAYSFIQRGAGSGQPLALWPMHPDQIEVIQRDGGIVYKFTPNNGGEGGTFDSAHVLHYKGLSPNGLKGYDPLHLERETFGHYLAAQHYGARTLNNDATPGGVLTHPGELDVEARKRVGDSWQAAFGSENRAVIAVLEEGMAFQPIAITPENAQFIETLKLKRADIAGIFRVPPHMIGDLDKATFSNIEHQDLGFAKHTLVPWCERMEQTNETKLLTTEEVDAGVYIQHNMNAIMRGDLKSRVESYGLLWDRGIVNADEIRELENMNPQPEELGQKYYIPMNYMEAGEDPPEPAPEPPPEPPSETPSEGQEEDENEPEEKSNPLAHETRWELREALYAARRGIQASAVGTLEDGWRRVVRRDSQNVRAALKRKSGQELINWLEEYFLDTDYARKQVAPALTSLAEALGSAMALEVDEDWQFTDQLRSWVESYIDNLANYHQKAAMVQLSQLVDGAEDEVRSAIEERLDTWENGSSRREPRAYAVANHESTRFGGAFAVVAFAAAGVTSLVWRATGDETCPWCLQMDGTVVGTGASFLTSDESLENDGEEFSPSNDVTHPPLHAGCDCVLSPE